MQASCGNNFTIFLTDKGECWAVGTGEKGVLGNGKVSVGFSAALLLFLFLSLSRTWSNS